MLIDANILLYAVDSRSPFHNTVRPWLEDALNGPQRVGLPWQSLTSFLRIVTNPRALPESMAPSEAWGFIDAWLDAPSAWIPEPGRGYREILGRLVRELHLSAKLIPDAALAALCIEHGLAIVSADTDFARFGDVRWINPAAAA